MKVLFRSIFHGRADKVPTQINRVIVAPTGKLGDMVCNTPVFNALRQNLPNARIIVAGNSGFLKSILDYSGLVDEYLDIDRDTLNADVAIVTGPSYEYAARFYLSGIPLIVAPTTVGSISPAETRPYKIIKKFVKTFPYRMGEYAPKERLKALESLGIYTKDTKKHLGFSENADRKIKQFFAGKSIDTGKDFVVGISPSAGNKIKEWPAERFAEVADYVAKKYNAKLLIIGGPKDKEKVQTVISNLSPETKAVVMTELSTDELKTLVSKLSLFISVDTGPIYIAEAFGIPTIDITGPIDEREQPPQGAIHRNVIPPHRLRPELSVLNAKHYNKEEALRQVNSITVPLVLKEVDSLIADIKK